MILVSGLPSSGNSFLRDAIQRETPEFVQVWHGDNESPNLTRPDGERCAVVIPVRNEPVRRVSLAKRKAAGGGAVPAHIAKCRRNLFALVAQLDLPVYLLSYEALVADPQRVGDDLFRWLGFSTRWSTDVYDANAAHPA